IPFNPADPWSLERRLEHEPAFKERYDQDEEVKALVDLARPLEGLTRNVGMHAGGVLIAPGKLTDFCPLYRQPGPDSGAVSQFDKDDVESAGLVKFDFLGLRNLTILDRALRYVRKFNPDKADFELSSLPLDDAATYKLLSEGNTTAVFQLESRGMKELLRSLQPSNFEDVIAMLALYRPGPLESGMVIDFVNRKHGREKADFFHPDLKPVLESTYGVIVYQEQVMLISQIIGNYTLGGADMLRRAMGRKDAKEMAEHRAIFEQGAIKKGYDGKLAVRLFDLMEKFAGYGFNKSHSAAYALIAYQTAWLKAHHPAEFIAATMSSDMDDTDKMQIFWMDALANNVSVLPPDINHSNYRFEPVNDDFVDKGLPPRTVRYGLGALKGAGQSAIHEIIAERERGGPYESLFDFCKRVDRHTVNRRTIEALVRAGAFDQLESNRAALFETIPQAIEAADQVQQNANQVSLFEDDSDTIVEHQLAAVAPWDLETQLSQEKLAMGFFFSGHLFDAWRDEIRRFVPKPLASLEPSREPQWFAGVIAAIRPRMTRRGRMVFVVLDDGSAQLEVAVFNELYEANRSRLREDALLIVRGKVSNDDYTQGLRVSADEIQDLQTAREARAKALRITIDSALDSSRLARLLNPFRAEPENGIDGVAVELELLRADFQCRVRLGEEWRVRMSPDLLNNLAQWVEPDHIEIAYR
ncbi:MAG TPA: DNA polymerase III subunit alpha, partial [Burkholderiaceae bacterium]|nr:DNA polymerase III subunit alpha [Burkholderiaceae bacterium]